MGSGGKKIDGMTGACKGVGCIGGRERGGGEGEGCVDGRRRAWVGHGHEYDPVAHVKRNWVYHIL